MNDDGAMGKGAGEDAQLPLSGRLFMTLLMTHLLVNAVLYVVNEIKFYTSAYRVKKLPTLEKSDAAKKNEPETLFAKVFSPSRLLAVKTSLVFVPVVCILMLYIMFRATAQHYDMDSSDYRFTQIGMCFATFGIFAQALDAFSIRIHSDVFGNLSESLGSAATYFGYGVLLWALFEVRDKRLSMSTASKCVVTLSAVLLVSMIGVKVVELMRELGRGKEERQGKKLRNSGSTFARSADSGTAQLDQLALDQRLDDVRTSLSYVPYLLVVFFHANFAFMPRGGATDPARYGMEAATTLAVVQAVAVFFKGIFGTLALLVQSVCTFFVLVAVGMVVYETDRKGASGSSRTLASSAVTGLLLLIAIIKVAIAFVQETTRIYIKGQKDYRRSQQQQQQQGLQKGQMGHKGGWDGAQRSWHGDIDDEEEGLLNRNGGRAAGGADGEDAEDGPSWIMPSSTDPHIKDLPSNLIARLHKTGKDLAASADICEMMCILFLFLHYRATIILHVEDPADYISSDKYLSKFILVSCVGIAMYAITLFIEAFTGPNVVISAATKLAMFAMQGSIIGIIFTR